MNNLPPEIYRKGTNGDFDTVVVEVRICRSKTGAVWSIHDLQDGTDRMTSQKWPAWGAHEISSALVVEAVRRAAFTHVLGVLSRSNPELLKVYVGATEKEKAEIETSLALAVEQVISQSVNRTTLSAVREILAMMVSQISPQVRAEVDNSSILRKI